MTLRQHARISVTMTKQNITLTLPMLESVHQPQKLFGRPYNCIGSWNMWLICFL